MYEEDKDIQFHDDIDTAFKPLKDFLSGFCDEPEKVMTQYMYMMHDEDKTYYKHFGDRTYFNIYHDGKTEGKLLKWGDNYDDYYD